MKFRNLLMCLCLSGLAQAAMAQGVVVSDPADGPWDGAGGGGEDCAGGIILDDGGFETLISAVLPDRRFVNRFELGHVRIVGVCVGLQGRDEEPTDSNYDIVMYAPDGGGDEPGTEIARVPATAASVPTEGITWYQQPTNVSVPAGLVYVGIEQDDSGGHWYGLDTTTFNESRFYNGTNWGPMVFAPNSTGSTRLLVEPEPKATFEVNKRFNDGNTAEVEVTLSCNTGLPLEQSADISPGDGVDFVVVDFADGEMDCTVTETSGPDGYTVSYFDGTATSSDGCSFEAVPLGSDFSCRVDNILDPVDIDVTKVWIDENPQFNAQNVAGANWCCTNVSDADEGFGPICGASGSLDFYGNPDTDSFQVFPDWDEGTTCSIDEVDLLESGIEVDDSECQGLVVFPGEGASCTIYNTRLYEGIPTLSQYGLGLLALLMLGMGFVAFRRVI